jgi:hypothetical protein
VVVSKPKAANAALPDRPQYTVEYRRADQLAPYAGNARLHSEEQIGQVIESITQFGFTMPIVADEFIRAGHARVAAALRLYAAGKRISLPNGELVPDGMVPVVDCSKWSAAQRKAYVLTDNKLTLNGAWDDNLLKIGLADLKAFDFDMEVTGFSAEEISKLTGADTANFSTDSDNSAGASEGSLMTFGKYKIRLSEEEEKELVALAEGYVNEFGTMFGFGHWVAERCNAAS